MTIQIKIKRALLITASFALSLAPLYIQDKVVGIGLALIGIAGFVGFQYIGISQKNHD